MSSSPTRLFTAAGLRFTCQQCHTCCRGGRPGWVYPSRRETERMAHFVKRSLASFRRRYMTKDPKGEPSLKMRANGDCFFWQGGCRIYAVRPRQCRTYPFWSDNLASAEAWAEVKKACRGAGRGRLYSLQKIRSILKGRST